ncbi:type I-F CRISPR-associated helicase Cas3f [Methylotuvimicrobium sp.]|uniref:type I-F CRISPR-associated helicase Cas3f n=1 Tax=Methylotuvimicrobium sp. TaxID=2822413 RepID=UPI003D65261D
MMVTFVSECEKKALNRTRRVLDAFANRIGSRTWQTVITEEGLQAVKKLLRKTATKNTAVSCHWIRSRSRSELVWVVGNRSKFNREGVVPVNYTETEITQFADNSQWKTIEIIKYAATIAGLFHDYGKANQLFQDKIDPNKKTSVFEPYRHEWVSLRLFQAFIGDKSDIQWLDALTQIDQDGFSNCFRDGLDGHVTENHPITDLPPFARLVAWLILTHHRLPICPAWKGVSVPPMESVDQWINTNFEAIWNSPNCKDKDQAERIEANWHFEKGLPVQSMQWRSKACLIASETITKLSRVLSDECNWLDEQLFSSHLARLCLMLSDHYYSSQNATPEWQNPHYQAFANTDKKTKQFKQQLDEHLIGVAHHAQKIVRSLPRFNATLRQLEKNAFLEANVRKAFKEEFGWQDQAKKLAQDLSKESVNHGFFGINMASTGKGKTLANAKIMYALGSETGRIRFNVALGLRTLTLQTGKEFREMLELTDEELAIMVGGIAAKELFENEQSKSSGEQKQSGINESSQYEGSGSESEEALDADLFVDYTGDIYDHSLSSWTKKNDKLEKLIQAPVLVSTIDHLIPATEGTKGGKQIGPMLRLLSSDLVLDEPDDFGLNDLPALCRLVNWAGILGSRVLLSTATMPPALVYALYQSYYSGWKQYAQANIENWDAHINCAWFDEFNTPQAEPVKEFDAFKALHKKFIKDRIKKLKENTLPQRKGRIISISDSCTDSIGRLADTVQQNILNLHKHHNQSKDGQTISIGLVRMANIDPLVAVAKALLKREVTQANTCIHYCVYHSHYPIGIRSYLEARLDKVLKRKKPEEIWWHDSVKQALDKHPQQHHVFVVLASPVAEVGRDHDYDWAIVEPSSMRSIIQLAGRVLRHRDHVPETANILLLNENYRALVYKSVCFEKPGFESAERQLAEKDLNSLLDTDQYQTINAVPRITLPSEYRKKGNSYLNLVELEHKALAAQLFGDRTGAKIWWRNNPHWCGEIQRQQRFRASPQDEAYYLWLEDSYSEPRWKWKNEHVYPAKFADHGSIVISSGKDLEIGERNNVWFNLDPLTIYSELANDFAIELVEVSRRFGEVRLIDYESNRQQEYLYHPNLGLYKEIGNSND